MPENDSAVGLAITIPEEVFDNLENLEQKIKSLETATDDTSKKIIVAFRNMANGVDPFIKKVNEANLAISNMLSAGGGQTGRFQDFITRIANALNSLGRGGRSVTDSLGDPAEVARLTAELKKQQQEIDRLNKAIAKLQQQQQGATSGRREATIAENTFRRAMFATEGTMTQRINKIAKLREAERQLTAAGKGSSEQIRIIRAEMGRLNRINQQAVATTDRVRKSQRHLMDISGQLMRRLALIFSVSQVTQYVQKLAQVRGEFELQNAALAAIMQNKDQADQLFGQITQLAVQSPFQLKELVTYTKELAAYRIENEKLYDTTKMLADVSAGLGVDMSRLILAYGQVKAANYLRGTELRQFSEAGINILGELATYFSEIENRAVSVGEVFDMVSNRMVTFQDVEEIFRRITSEGGIFANMQEVQSRTLAGMISNMQDAVDVMLNEIGIASEDVLKGSVEAVGDLVRNWREVAYMMKEAAVVVGSIAGYFGLARIASSKLGNALFGLAARVPILEKAILSFSGAVQQARTSSLLAGAAMQGFGNILGGLATAGVTAAIGAIVIGLMNFFRTATRASREARRLREEISGILSTDVTNINNSVVMYGELVEKLGQVNRGSGEHRDLIAQINSQYGEYLGYIVDETTSYEQLKDSIDSVTESMVKRAQMASREKGLQAIYESTANDISKSQSELREVLSSSILSGLGRSATEKEIQSIFGLIEKYVRDTGSKINASGLSQILSQFYGEDVSLFISNTKMLTTLSEAYLRQKEGELYLQNQINQAYGEQYDTAEALNAIEANDTARKQALADIRKRTDLTRWELEQQEKAINQEFDLNEIDIKVRFDVLTPEEGERQKKKLIEWATATVADVNEQVSKSLKGQGFTDEMISRYLITPDMQATGIPEIEKTVIQSWRQATESIERFNRLKAAGNEIDEQQLQNMINQQKGWYAVAEALGIVDQLKKKSRGGSGKDPEEERIKKIIAMLKEMRSQYEKLRKEYAEDEATQMIRTSYEATAEDLKLPEGFLTTMTFDTSGILDGVKRISETTRKEYNKFWNEYTDSLNTEVGIELRVKNREKIQEDIDSLFTDYQMTLELEKLGGDRDIAELLGIDFTSLEDLKIKGDVQAIRLEAIGSEEALKQAKELREKISDVEDKRLEENTKKYFQYLNESKDRRILIEEEAQRKIKEIQESRLTEEQKKQATANVQRDTRQAIAEYDWDQFKDTDLYRMAFEDLERVGTGTLDILIRKLQEFSETSGRAMSTEDFRELMNSMKNARDELEQRNPWKTLLNSIQDYRDATANLKSARVEQAAAQEDVDFRTQERDAAQEDVDSAQADYDKAQSLEERVAALERLVAAQNRLSGATTNLEEAQAALAVAEGKVVKAENEQQSSATSMVNTLNNISSEYSSMVGGINGLIDAFLELAEGMGLAVDDDTQAAIEGFQKGFSVLGSIMSTLIPIITAITVGGTAMMATLWPLLAIGAALGAVFAIVKVHDANRQKIIDAELDKIENLQDSYDDLTDSLDDITSTGGLQNYKRELDRNIDQQIASYDRAIAAEKDKKNPDEEQIAQWEKEQEELLKQGAEDLEAALVQAGGIAKDEYLSTTEDFVDAWLEAFKETGDGLSGLEDNFKDFFLNIMKRQAALAVSNRFIDPWIDDLNAALEDSELDDKEAASLISSMEEIYPGLNAALEAIFGPLKDWMASSYDELSGLQKGIQGITEETAQALEALLNSVRYYTADSNMQLRNIYAILSGTSDIATNPMLAELRSQTQMMTAINRLLNSVVKAGHPEGGSGIRVFMN